MRISVELILSLMAQGETAESILDRYPGLEAADRVKFLAFPMFQLQPESR